VFAISAHRDDVVEGVVNNVVEKQTQIMDLIKQNTKILARRIAYLLVIVGITSYGCTYKEGKKIGWKNGLRAIWCIFKYNSFTP
jgi:hypothetical protein